MSMSQLLEREQITTVDFLKVDIEGSEFGLLRVTSPGWALCGR